MDGRMWKNVKDKSVVKNLKAITSFEELEKVLKYIQNMQSENIRTLVSEQFDMLPRLKSTCSRWTVSCVHSIVCIANAVIMHKEWGRADCLRPIG